MTTILVLTVGNSPEPLKQCITRIRPQRVLFVCSDDTQQAVEDLRRQVRIEDFDPTRDVEVLSQGGGARSSSTPLSAINEIDQLHIVYTRCRDLLNRLHREAPGARISVDHTGGTKTMSTGMGMAAIDDGRVELTVTTTERRRKGESSIKGISTPIPVESGAIQFRRLLSDGLQPLLQRHDYAAAQGAVSDVLRMRHEESSTRSLRRLDDLLLAFDAWDRWDLEQASLLLKDHASEAATRDRFLLPIKRIIQSCDLLNLENQSDKSSQAIKGGKLHGFEAVEDLLLNAARRASQQRYDDAVGRLYRSMELTAQLLLQIDHDGIRTGDVQLELLPEALRTVYEQMRSTHKGKIQLALAPSFDLLADLGNAVGMIWRNRRRAFVDVLEVRNQSLLAHGFRPVTYTDWQRLDHVLGGFLRSVLDQKRGKLAPLEQFPDSLTALGVREAASVS